MAKYRVALHPAASCTCEDFVLRQEACKHVLAVRIACERDGGAQGPEIVTDEVPKRPACSQNWPAYNLAQREEKDRFQVLLADLCAGLPDPERYGARGRKPRTVADKLFAVCLKVYTTLSSRRFGSDIVEAHERGRLSCALHPNKINIILETPEIAPHPLRGDFEPVRARNRAGLLAQ